MRRNAATHSFNIMNQQTSQYHRSTNFPSSRWKTTIQSVLSHSVGLTIRSYTVSCTVKWYCSYLYHFIYTSMHIYIYIYKIIEGSLEFKLLTMWRDEKAVSREKSQKRKDQKKEDAGARKGRKVAKHCVFSWFCGSGGSKSRLAKAAGAETSGEMRDEKLHAVVARSRFRSEKVQNTSAPDRFWRLRCWKSAWRCGAKHIWK